MGWFRRAKVSDTENEQKTEQPQVDIKTDDNTGQSEELTGIEDEITEKHTALKSVSDRLVSVKKEYDGAVAGLMAAKKELSVKKRESEALTVQRDELLEDVRTARAQIDMLDTEIKDKKQQVEEVSKSSAVLAEIKDEIARSRKEAEGIKKSMLESQSALERTKSEQQKADADLRDTSEMLNSARAEMQELTARKDRDDASITREFVAGEPSSDSGKNIVEAASAVVASMSQKLKAAERELETVKKVLERERREHGVTRKKLSKLQSQNQL